MAETLISVINAVFRACARQGNKTAIAEADSSAFIRDQINKALRKIYKQKPFTVDADGTITITPSTRTFSGPTDTELQNIHSWSWRINDSAGDRPVDYVTEQFIIENYPSFETDEAPYPDYVYFTNNTVGIYPLLTAGSSNLTLQFKYSTQFVALTSTSATFPFEVESDELEYCRLYAQLKYEVIKGLGQPGVTNEELNDVWAALVAKYRKGKQFGVTGHRRYGR